MRIALVTKPHLPVLGGGQLTVHWLARALAARGHEVTVLVTGQKAPGAGATLGYPVLSLPDDDEDASALLADLAPDTAIVNGFHGHLVRRAAAFLAARGRLPCTAYIHDARALELAARADRVVAVSHFLARLAGPAASVIPPIVDRDRYRVDTTSERVLFVTPVPSKGLATAIALARARPDIPFTFQRCWERGPDRDAALREELQGLRNVELRPATAEPGAIYRDARILIVPSIAAEGYGRVAREAQTSGIPVVAAAVGGLPDAVGSGGTLVDRRAGIDGWLSELGRLWDDPDVYARAAARAERQGADPATSSAAVARAFEDSIATVEEAA